MVLLHIVVQESRLMAALPSLTCDVQGHLGVAASVPQKRKRAAREMNAKLLMGRPGRTVTFSCSHSLIAPQPHGHTVQEEKGNADFCRIAVFAITSEARKSHKAVYINFR